MYIFKYIIFLLIFNSYQHLQANENDSPVWVTWQERNKPLSNTQMSNLGHEKLHQSPVTIHNHYTDKNQATHTTTQKNQHTNWANNWLSRQKETSGTSSPVTRPPPPPQAKPNNTIITLKKNTAITVQSVTMGSKSCTKKQNQIYQCPIGRAYNFIWTDQDGKYRIYLPHPTVQSVIDLSQQSKKTTLKTFSSSSDKSNQSTQAKTNLLSTINSQKKLEGITIDFKDYFPIKPHILYDKNNVIYSENIYVFTENINLYTQENQQGCLYTLNIEAQKGRLSNCWQRIVQLPNAVNLKAQSITTDQPLVSCYPEQQAEKIHCLSPLIINQFSIFINHPKNKAFTATASQYKQEKNRQDTSDPEESLPTDDTPTSHIVLRANRWSTTIMAQFKQLIDKGYHFKYQYTRKDGSISSTDSSLLPLSKDIIAGKEPFAGLERHFSHFPDYIHVLIFAPNPQDNDRQNKSCAVWNWTIGYQKSKGLDVNAITSQCDTHVRLRYPALLKHRLRVQDNDHCKNDPKTSQIICTKTSSDGHNTVNLILNLSNNITIKKEFSIENKTLKVSDFSATDISTAARQTGKKLLQITYQFNLDPHQAAVFSNKNLHALQIKWLDHVSEENLDTIPIIINIKYDTAYTSKHLAFFKTRQDCEALRDMLKLGKEKIRFVKSEIERLKLRYTKSAKSLWLTIANNSGAISACYPLTNTQQQWEITIKDVY